jgi:hypothetical protein
LLGDGMESLQMPSMNSRISVRLMNMRVCSLVLLSVVTVLLSGCGNFFTCEGKASCPSSGGGGTGGSGTDYAYVANSATGSTYIDAYSLSSGTLTALTGSPFSLNYTPSAMTITPANTYMYAASDSALTANVGYIYGYSIGTGGALSILSSGTPLVNENVTSLAISPDGKWLFCLDDDPGTETLEEYGINSSTGALTYENTYGVNGAPNAAVLPFSVTVAPTGDYVAVALGTAGVETFAFDTTTGVATATAALVPATAATGIYGVAVDSNNDLYAVGTAGLQVFSATTAGYPTLLNTYPTGNGAHSIAINSASTYVYVGNETDSTITGYAIGTNAALTALSGSPYPAPTTVTALARDSTSAYLIASGYNAGSGIQLFSIGSTGALTLNGSAGSGTSTAVPGVIAAMY